ncbi:hypothetical protein NOM80_17060, partial [Proteus mirabilis]|uniref:hypothetical protein n=3 Tax=Proteus mirabilis TaxID=584 RepID=UPI00217EB57C
MKIETKIKNEGKAKTEITIDKFFQFIIFRDYNSDKLKVSIYTALSFHSDNKSSESKLHVTFKVDNKSPNGIKNKDKSNFYHDNKVLSRFWGESCNVNNSISDSLNSYINTQKNKGNDEDACFSSITPEQIEEFSAKVNKTKEFTDYCVSISEEKELIKDLLLIPYKIRELDGSKCIILEERIPNIHPEIIFSNGYWFRTDFEINVSKLDKNEFYFSSDIILEKAKFTSPDFKVYFLTPESYELKSNSITLLPDNKISNSSKEIIKILSKKDIVYFKEWIDLGIYSSSLYKLQL